MKKILLSILLTLLVTLSLTGCKKDYPKVVNITRYELGGEKVLTRKIITDQDIIKKIVDYVDEIKTLSESEMVDLALAREIVITYDDVTVNFTKSFENYCDYTNKKDNVDSLAKLPKGLYDLVIDIVKDIN